VSSRESYVGQALQGVDDKARLAIPAGIRAALDRNGDPESKDRLFVLTTHETDPCLVGYDEAFLNARIAEIEAREQAHLAATGRPDFTIRRTVIGVPERLSYDASGRFVLPAFARFHANIDTNAFAFVHGLGSHFEIWDPKTLIDWPGSPEITKKAARFYMAQKGVTL
jgi:MraZ protein